MSDKKVADLYLSQFEPRPRLEVKQTNIVRPRFPVIDAHNHLAEPFGGDWEKSPLSELLNVLDQADVRFFVDLDGGWGEDILNPRAKTAWGGRTKNLEAVWSDGA